MTRQLIISLFMCIQFVSNAQSYIGYLKRECALMDSKNKEVGRLKKGEGVFIFPNSLENDECLVNHILTNREGYISTNNIHIVHQVKESSDAGFAVKELEQKNPIIRIHNDSRTSMRFRINGSSHEILPKEEKNIPIKKGIYTFIVTAPNVDPHYGRESLEEYKMYEWEFYIDKR